MAEPDRASSDHLTFLRSAQAEPERHGFLALLRAAEARAPALPRIGRSRSPSQNVVDLAHAPAMEFPTATVAEIEAGRTGRMRVRSLFLGLTGPMGALPLHLTEYATYERRSGRNRPFGRFLDLLTDRMLQFFYRAWADSQPVTHAERAGDDRFARYIAALSGAGEAVGEDATLPVTERLHYAGLFATKRSAAALQDGLSHLLNAPVRIEEFVGRWRQVEPEDHTRLIGSASRRDGFNQLGRGAVLGGRVRIAQDTFRVIVRTETLEAYQAMLPGGARHAAAREALNALSPSHLDWELQLEIDERRTSPARLDGGARLSMTSWVAPEGQASARRDARFRRNTRTVGAERVAH